MYPPTPTTEIVTTKEQDPLVLYPSGRSLDGSRSFGTINTGTDKLDNIDNPGEQDDISINSQGPVKTKPDKMDNGSIGKPPKNPVIIILLLW